METVVKTGRNVTFLKKRRNYQKTFVPLQQDFRKTKADMDNNNTDPTPDPSP